MTNCFVRVLLLFLASLYLYNCSSPVQTAGGNTTETGNTISGVIIDDTRLDPRDDRSNRVPDAVVTLYPEDFNPRTSGALPEDRQVKTNSRGEYLFKQVTEGIYNIHAAHPEKSTVTLVQGVEVAGSGNEEIETGNNLLLEPGIIRVSLTDLTVEKDGYMYIPGTGIYTQVDSAALANGYLALEAVPAGTYSTFEYKGAGETFDLTIYRDISLNASDTVALGEIPDTRTIVSGRIVDENGNPASGAVVRLVPENYNPLAGEPLPDSLMDFTDAQGAYSFYSISSGAYHIEAIDLNDGSRLAGGSISVSGDATTVPDHALQQPGTVVLYFPDSMVSEGGYLFIPGTGVYAKVDAAAISLGRVVLSAVPAGEYQDVRFSEKADISGAVVVAEKISITSSETVVVSPYHAWAYSRKIYINTSLDGADIAEDVVNFPLLVRLSGFDVSQSNGSDLRFSKPDYTPLPFEIERWDPAVGGTGAAEIWVKMDTVYGNNNTQFIYMYTGNSISPAAGSGTAAFDTADSFAGVWHLGEEGNTALDGYKDATFNSNNGTGVNMTADSDTEAAVGKGHSFTGDSNFISCPMPSFLSGDPTFSVSFWMNFSMTQERAGILYFGRERRFEGIHFLIMEDTTAQFGPWDQPKDSTDVSDQQNWFPLEDYLEQWIYVSTVYDAEKNILTSYVNGNPAAINSLSGLSIDGSGKLYFGRRIAGHESEYKGSLDEIRISSVARSDAWIKLSYENQKSGSEIVSIE